MKTRKSTPGAVLALLLTVTVVAAVSVSAAESPKPLTPILISQLAGPWQTLTGSSAGCGQATTTQTFQIISLNGNGSGVAGLTCGSGCGWTFNIQVSPNRQVINLVDVTDPAGNVLAGTAVKQ